MPRPKNELTEAEKVVAAFTAWQTEGKIIPFTCQHGSGHRPLRAYPLVRRVLLTCPDCEYETVLEADLRRIVLHYGEVRARR